MTTTYKGKDTWFLIRRYQRLVRRGLARAFLCPDCDTELITVITKEDEVAMWCVTDDRGFLPGVRFWADVNAVVTEFYVED